MTTLGRWLTFNAIGILGAGVQLWFLHLLTSAGVEYLAATALAVEAAVLHNFAWHQRYTWADRPTGDIPAAMVRLFRFHLSNGTVSIVANVLLMRWLVGGLRAGVLVANGLAILVCSIVNFLLGDRFVFSAGDCHA
jgi:putative flippase GtrA